MTQPMTPREKVKLTLKSWCEGGLLQDYASVTDAILTALASGSGDHANHSGDATNMVDHAELCERLRDTYIRFNMGHREAPLRNPDGPLAAEALGALLAENAAMRGACAKSNDEICQALGKALGYPWFKDDQVNFPGATDENGVCVGDHVAESLADEAARRITEAERKLTEAVGLLRDVVSPGWTRDAWSKARAFLSKEAER